MFPVAGLSPQAGLHHAAKRLAETRLPALPVIDGVQVVGWLRERQLSALLSKGADTFTRLIVADAMEAAPSSLLPSASLAQMQHALHENNDNVLPIVDEEGRYLGCITQTGVLSALLGKIDAPRMGGMATPLGVYMTTGRVSGGAGFFGLLLTGAFMSIMIFIVQTVLPFAALLLYRQIKWPILLNLLDVFGYSAAHLPQISPLMDLTVSMAGIAMMIACFLLLLRYAPLLAGYHAAEHQTINALEEGEPLTTEAVARMSRVHPRCGTNYGAFLNLTYLGVAVLVTLASRSFAREDPGSLMLYVVTFIVVVLINWKRIGGWVQQHFTTRPATRRELASGIRAAEEVLQNHFQHGSMAPPHPFQRVWNMGLAQVMIGLLLMGYILQIISTPLDRLAQSLLK